jgi:sporulation protein YlmC with PRC-barrel domain
MTMERTILFQKNAGVLTGDGKQIGSLQRVVLHPETKVITDIVVQGGGLFNKEYRVVPVDMIAETAEDQIRLRDEAGEWKSFPLFEERHLVSETEGSHAGDVKPVIYGVPGVGPAVTTVYDDSIVTELERNIPEGTVALKEGAKVYTSDDKHIGNVDRVLADPSGDEATHLIISQGLLAKEKKLIPMRWVEMLGENTVHLGVTEADVNALETPLNPE